MRAAWTVLLIVLLAATTAGCVDTDGQDEETDATDDAASAGHALLGGRTLPSADGNRTSDWLASFVSSYSPRVTATPGDDAAAAFLVKELEAAGYTVEVMRFAPLLGPVEGGPLKAIVALKEGTETPERWVAWGGHYDTAAGTVEGAYDNGSGTAMTLELARVLGAVETNRTQAAILFNGEEEGVLASSAFVDWYEAQDGFTIDLFVGFDMVGIGYPAPGRPLAAFSGAQYSSDLVPMLSEVAFDIMGLPRGDESAVMVRPENTRNSDEASFKTAGVPTLRFAGLATAGAYWGYHEANDTMETIYAMSGPTPDEGKANFAGGLDNTARWAAGMVLAVDARAPLYED